MLYANHYRLFLQDILDRPNASAHMWSVIEAARANRPMTRFIPDGSIHKDMWHLLPKDLYSNTRTATPWSALVLGVRE